jgi:prepilin-type N-terminal cleavage/methylation domain-containing protein
MRTKRGFSLIEMLVVITMMGLMLAIVVPKFRVSPYLRVNTAADQMVKDLELVRLKAMTTRNVSRMLFTAGTQDYTGYLDNNADGIIAQNAAEIAFLGAMQPRTFTDGVIYGRGTAPIIPGYAGAGPITFANSRIDFDNRGLTTPLGTKGVVYLTSSANSSAVSAVTVTAGAGIRRWVYRGGAWQ